MPRVTSRIRLRSTLIGLSCFGFSVAVAAQGAPTNVPQAKPATTPRPPAKTSAKPVAPAPVNADTPAAAAPATTPTAGTPATSTVPAASTAAPGAAATPAATTTPTFPVAGDPWAPGTAPNAAAPPPAGPGTAPPPPVYYVENVPGPNAPAPEGEGALAPEPPAPASPMRLAIEEPPPPPIARHRAPRTAFWLGARGGWWVPFGDLWGACDAAGYGCQSMKFGDVASSGPMLELDIGARLGRNYNVYALWERAQLGKGNGIDGYSQIRAEYSTRPSTLS